VVDFYLLEKRLYDIVCKRTAYLPVRGKYYDASERLDTHELNRDRINEALRLAAR
jgi:hypothetical protein